MMRFIRCKNMDGDTILLAEYAVKYISRVDRDERADVLHDYDGNVYECYDEIMACPSWDACIEEAHNGE